MVLWLKGFWPGRSITCENSLGKAVERSRVRKLALERARAQWYGRDEWKGTVEHKVREWMFYAIRIRLEFHTSPLFSISCG